MRVFDGRGHKISAGASFAREYTRSQPSALGGWRVAANGNECSVLCAGPAQTAVVQVSALDENLRHNRFKRFSR